MKLSYLDDDKNYEQISDGYLKISGVSDAMSGKQVLKTIRNEYMNSQVSQRVFSAIKKGLN